MVSVQAIFSPTYHKMLLNAWPVPPAGYVGIPCRMSPPDKIGPFIDHPGQLQKSDMLKKEASVKADCRTFGCSTHLNC